MRAVILLVLFYSSSAASADGQSPVLDVAVKTRRSVEWTRVYQGPDGWYCATEHNPRFSLEARPKALDRVREAQSEKKGCRSTFTARLKEGTVEKTWSGCREGEAKAFLETLGKECGRF